MRWIVRWFWVVLYGCLTLSSAHANPLVLAMAQRPDIQHAAATVENAVVRTCKVTSVHDGDSMRARCPGFKDTLRIRLSQIDAPELEQAHGIKSRDYLRSLCPRGQEVIVHDLGKDTYNRRLGRVFCSGIDVNAAMVESGSAWVYDHYADDKQLYRLQDMAKSQQRGLWANKKGAVAPWTFRYQQRKNQK